MKITLQCCNAITGRHSPFCEKFTVTGKPKQKPKIQLKMRTKSVPHTRRTHGELIFSARWSRWSVINDNVKTMTAAKRLKVQQERFTSDPHRVFAPTEYAIFVNGKKVS